MLTRTLVDASTSDMMINNYKTVLIRTTHWRRWAWEVNMLLAGLLCKSDDTSCVEIEAFPITSNVMTM